MNEHGDKLKELLDEQRRQEAYPLFVGAVAISKDQTLVTKEYPFIMAMAEAKEHIDTAPERFRPRIEHFDIQKSYIREVSDEADMVFRILNICADEVRWVYYYSSSSGLYTGNRYIMSDADAQRYIDKEGFTEEELEWLWWLAQKMHATSDKPVERREPNANA